MLVCPSQVKRPHAITGMNETRK